MNGGGQKSELLVIPPVAGKVVAVSVITRPGPLLTKDNLVDDIYYSLYLLVVLECVCGNIPGTDKCNTLNGMHKNDTLIVRGRESPQTLLLCSFNTTEVLSLYCRSKQIHIIFRCLQMLMFQLRLSTLHQY